MMQIRINVFPRFMEAVVGMKIGFRAKLNVQMLVSSQTAEAVEAMCVNFRQPYQRRPVLATSQDTPFPLPQENVKR